MTSALMRLARPGSFAWLALHEMRLALRSRPVRGLARWAGYALAVLWLAAGCALGWVLRDTPIPQLPIVLTAVFAAAVFGLTFMTAQAMLGSLRTVYQSGDLSLLFTAPMPARNVLLAKLLGIAGSVAAVYAVFLLPLVVPVAVLGHPRLFGLVAVLLALALSSAALGMSITLGLARAVGPRAARTIGQIVAALLGGAVFLTSQLMNHGDRNGRATGVMFERLRASGVGSTGWSALPGRAAFGDPLAIVVVLGIALLLFAAAGATLQRAFVSGYQDGGSKLSRGATRGRASRRASGRLFHAGLVRSVFAKEWRLLVRDPALAFQIVLRLVYMAPIVLLAFGRGHTLPLPPALAFGSVLIASQLVGSFAWLTVSAEDTPDLLVVAPVARSDVAWAKLLAAFAMAAPFAIVLPIAIATQSMAAALFTLAMTVLGSGAAGFVELKLGKPAARATFNRRRGGSVVAGILSLLVALVFGGLASTGVFWIGGGMDAIAARMPHG